MRRASRRRHRSPSGPVRRDDAREVGGGWTGDARAFDRWLARERARVVVNHHDHVALLARGITQGEGGTWADLVAGTGAFTLALADLIGPHAVIHTIDRYRSALADLRTSFVR